MPSRSRRPAALPSPLDLSPITLAGSSANDPEMTFTRRMRFVQSEFKVMLTTENLQLAVWYWPVLNGVRVTPDELYEYRQHHVMKLPCCFCVLPTNDPNAYTEVKVFLATRGAVAGRHIAACATGNCRYWMFFDACYTSRCQRVKAYPIRGERDPLAPALEAFQEPPEVPSSPTAVASSTTPPTIGRRRRDASTTTPTRPIKRRRTRTVDPTIIVTGNPPPPEQPKSEFELMLKLDAVDRPGLTEAQFCCLFVKCSVCSIYTTKGMFNKHHCLNPRPTSDVIDLTISDSDSD
ncbi:hypothetical protein GGX14DRAFT_567422 [Mycena pura]|uniref:Uncharacterized protein n=1 Tax=Mycena pura TaxID=153505 RepID=A0AAD6VEI6_9AGAR|nr:hypothetical protein GGX14DRAFT_567422 [Mycena pura]